MNHSPEPGSPISASSSSDDEAPYTQPSNLAPRGSQSGPWSSFMSNTFTGAGGLLDFAGPGKRRNPPGSFGNLAPMRDAKSRRREEDPRSLGRRGPQGSGMNAPWAAEGGSKKDDLVDQHIVEQLRIQFGDPFDESGIKNAS